MITDQNAQITLEPLMRHSPNGPEHLVHVSVHPDVTWTPDGMHFTVLKNGAKRRILEFELSPTEIDALRSFLNRMEAGK